MEDTTIRKELNKLEPKLIKARMKVASLEAQENILFELLEANHAGLDDEEIDNVCID